MTSFVDLELIDPLQRALADLGYREPTPIQARAIPSLLAGRDLLAVAPTGTGKTAAFALPLLQRLAAESGESGEVGGPRALVLAPTRELAEQTARRIEGYGAGLDLRGLALFGGAEIGPQAAALDRGVDWVVATPGRLLDLERRGRLRLDRVAWLALDEADRVLDAGFAQELRAALRRLPADRQSLLFSATMPPAIERLAGSLLRDPVRIDVAPPEASGQVSQQVMFVRGADKPLLLAHLLGTLPVERGLVFVRTRERAARVAKGLIDAGHRVAALHGDLPQGERDRALTDLRAGQLVALVATDVAARGIDVRGVSHVFNYGLPYEPETYIHRVGRTGRAGRDGAAISFCDDTDGGALRDIERRLGAPLTPAMDQPWNWYAAIPDPKASGRKRRGGRRSRRRR